MHKYNIGDKVRFIKGAKINEVAIPAYAQEERMKITEIKNRPWKSASGACNFTYQVNTGWVVPEIYLELLPPKKTLYKVVHYEDTPDGRVYSSSFVGQTIGGMLRGKEWGGKLEYAIGMKTYSPNGGSGIFLWNDLDRAKKHAEGKGGMTTKRPCTVLEVETTDAYASIYTQEKAVSVLPVADLMPPTVVKKEWVDITEECNYVPYKLLSQDGYNIQVKYDKKLVAVIWGRKITILHGFKVEEAREFGETGTTTFTFMKKVRG